MNNAGYGIEFESVNYNLSYKAYASHAFNVGGGTIASMSSNGTTLFGTTSVASLTASVGIYAAKLSNTDNQYYGQGEHTLSPPAAGRTRIIWTDINDTGCTLTYGTTNVSIRARTWVGMFSGSVEGKLTSLSGGSAYNIGGVSGYDGYAPKCIVEYCLSSTTVLWLT